jgi:hypothetical protein
MRRPAVEELVAGLAWPDAWSMGAGASSRRPLVRSKATRTSPRRELRRLQIGERGGGLAVRRVGFR